MTSNADHGLTIFAPAKINLYLHITGKRTDGYHTLDSLVGFVDIGDTIRITPAESFSLAIDGPFADCFTAAERDTGPDSANIVIRAARTLAARRQKELTFKITLTKNLPLAAGMGGGSADAAATLWGLMEFWQIRPQAVPDLTDLMLELGADVPVCLPCRTTIMRGIGEELSPPPPFQEIPILLINPLESCSTAALFKAYQGPYRPNVTWPARFASHADFISFLRQLDNDLTPGALAAIPAIKTILDALEQTAHCALARMSGSGATCFGLFDTEEHAQDAARALQEQYPSWWIKAGTLGRPVRY